MSFDLHNCIYFMCKIHMCNETKINVSLTNDSTNWHLFATFFLCTSFRDQQKSSIFNPNECEQSCFKEDFTWRKVAENKQILHLKMIFHAWQIHTWFTF